MSDQTPPFDPAKVAPLLLQSGHVGWLELKYRDSGDDWVELELPWREDLIGDAERPILASGPIISMMDMAAGMAIWTRNGGFSSIATLDLRVDYQRPARERSAVVGHVECYKLTKSAAFVRGVAHDGDPADPVAHIAGIFMSLLGAPRNV